VFVALGPSPTTAAPGIAGSISRFTVSGVPDPDHAEPTRTLEAMHFEHLVFAHSVHSAPGAHG
jgi:hypothetical protein